MNEMVKLQQMLNETKSNGALAVAKALEKALKAVLEKHPRRGDAWESSFSAPGCFELSAAKLQRVILLFEGMSNGSISHSECAEELTEEGVDAIVYIAFGLWKIGRL